MIDRILQPFRSFCRAYIDDIVIFSSSLEQYIEYLRQVFTALSVVDIYLSPKKSFLYYPSIYLLGQKIDILGMSTAADKLLVITSLSFPRNLLALKKYLSLTGYLRQYIPYYTTIVKPL